MRNGENLRVFGVWFRIVFISLLIFVFIFRRLTSNLIAHTHTRYIIKSLTNKIMEVFSVIMITQKLLKMKHTYRNLLSVIFYCLGTLTVEIFKTMLGLNGQWLNITWHLCAFNFMFNRCVILFVINYYCAVYSCGRWKLKIL